MFYGRLKKLRGAALTEVMCDPGDFCASLLDYWSLHFNFFTAKASQELKGVSLTSRLLNNL